MRTDHPGATAPPASGEDSPTESVPARLYTLRDATSEDLEQLAQLERTVFPTVWPPMNFAREIRMPDHAILVVTARNRLGRERRGGGHSSLGERVANGIRALAGGVPGGPGSESRLAGWAVVWFIAGEAHIASIGVAPDDRRRGVGELLILGAIEASVFNGCHEVTLEVRKSNAAAKALYRKYGLRDVGERKGYYVDDNEDALIMTTPDIRDPGYAQSLADLATDHAIRWEGAGSRFERA